MAQRSKTLGEKITDELIKPKNKDIDIEDVGFNDKLRNDGSSDESNDEEEDKARDDLRNQYIKVSKSRLKHRSVELGDKYQGKQSNRAQIFGDQESEGDSDDDDDDDDDDDNNNDESVASEGSSNKEPVDDESSDSTENISYGLSGTDKGNNIGQLLEKEKSVFASRLSNTVKADALKGYAILQQNKLFDKILDTRIKLQKALSSSNELPVNKKVYEQLKSEETDSKLKKAKKQLALLTMKIEKARSRLYVKDSISKDNAHLSNEPDFKNCLKTFKKEQLMLEPYKKSVLIKWSKRVQNASGATALNASKFRNINQSVYAQLENTLQNMDRLIRRTRTNRQGVQPIGYEPKQIGDKSTQNDDDDNNSDESPYQSNVDKSLQENPYIFDDNDFYRVLLNDLVNKKISDKQAMSSASILTLSSNRNTRNYDSKANKGRKLKFTVQEELQNFEAPKAISYSWNDDRIDQLFASLFGQKVSMSESEESESENESEDESGVRGSKLRMFG